MKRLALVGLVPSAALLVAACGSNSPSPGSAYGGSTPTTAAAPPSASSAPMTPAKAVLTVRKTSIGYVLATSAGKTIYWYSKDVKGGTSSACTGSCASAWPAVVGTPAAAPGVELNGKLGSITGPGGTVQATYNGYPLYTYASDTSPGQTTGNGVGGVWHVITGHVLSPSPASAAEASIKDTSGQSGASPSSAATSSSSSGYNYSGGY